MNKVARAVYQARKDGQEITANIRLKKNGQFASVSGTVQNLKVSRDGFAYITMKIGEDKYQNVRMANIRHVNKDNKLYKVKV